MPNIVTGGKMVGSSSSGNNISGLGKKNMYAIKFKADDHYLYICPIASSRTNYIKKKDFIIQDDSLITLFLTRSIYIRQPDLTLQLELQCLLKIIYILYR